MRVIAGEYRGRKLAAPKGDSVRPTADRVKEALFSMLSGFTRGAKVLDVFAGTGSLGIEALSRGADFCLFIENSAFAAETLKANLDELRIGREAQLERMDFRTAMARHAGFGADIVFIDPPYRSGLYAETMQSLVRYDMIKRNGIAALESAGAGEADAAYDGFIMRKKKRYGKTFVTVYERMEQD
ncbi:MAG: 16S rRNA (guanine(966)-N(2))-methyltransferase RsmD [Clostridiales Family XIII bacterium]|jgi:16S rRNA (guanine(966)-N(2))-methyltransferase RsmD|nr:16S rRNA (guanine(966)-N(2))-methyltransferase RsmD [Clostridiales Family XIII bacterium]